MAKSDFFDIKGLGNLPDEQGQETPKPVNRAPRPYQKPKRSYRTLLMVAAAVVVLVVLAGAAYWYHKHHKSTAAVTQTPAISSSQPSASNPSPTVSTSGANQTYVSNGKDLNLSFSYLSDWTVTPLTNSNATDQPINVTSPLATVTAADGASVTGKVVVMIRPGSSTISELAKGSATIPVASVQFGYTHPTPAQHQYPYLTFMHFPTGSSVAGAFEEVLVTGVSQFPKGGSVDATALASLDPIISASFYKCATTACTGTSVTPLSITSGTWQNASLFQHVQALFASLKLN